MFLLIRQASVVTIGHKTPTYGAEMCQILERLIFCGGLKEKNADKMKIILKRINSKEFLLLRLSLHTL